MAWHVQEEHNNMIDNRFFAANNNKAKNKYDLAFHIFQAIKQKKSLELANQSTSLSRSLKINHTFVPNCISYFSSLIREHLLL
jgi:hypothetical protein